LKSARGWQFQAACRLEIAPFFRFAKEPPLNFLGFGYGQVSRFVDDYKAAFMNPRRPRRAPGGGRFPAKIPAGFLRKRSRPGAVRLLTLAAKAMSEGSGDARAAEALLKIRVELVEVFVSWQTGLLYAFRFRALLAFLRFGAKDGVFFKEVLPQSERTAEFLNALRR
jgi:hypothetical protein